MMRTAVVVALAALISGAAASEREMEVAGRRRRCERIQGPVCLRDSSDMKVYRFGNMCAARRYKRNSANTFDLSEIPCPQAAGFAGIFSEVFEDRTGEEMDEFEDDFNVDAAVDNANVGAPMAGGAVRPPMAPRAGKKVPMAVPQAGKKVPMAAPQARKAPMAAPMAAPQAGKKVPMAAPKARAPRAMAPQAKKPMPFPKLDKKMCTKLLDMSGKPPCDMKSDKVVCAKNGVTYPNRCSLMIYICHQMMNGKTPIAFEKDGWCAKGKDSYCAAPFMKCKKEDKVDLVCVQMGPKMGKDTLKYARNACQAKIWTACTVPNLQTVKLDACKKFNVPLPQLPPAAPGATRAPGMKAPGMKAPKAGRAPGTMSPGRKAPGARAPGAKAPAPMAAPKAKNDPKMDCLRMKCDPSAVKEEWCGSDGKTYTNRCQIMFDNCMKRIKAPMGKPAKCNINGKCTKPTGSKPDYVKPLFQGACPKTCKTASDCGPKENCVGTCVPKILDKCAVKKCASGKKCKEVCDGKKSVTGLCMGKMVASCISTSVKASCDLNALQNCVTEANKANPNMSPCAKLVAQSKCAEDCECFNAAKRLCNSGVLIQEDGKVKRFLPPNCAAPACGSAKVVDPKCKKADYKACKAKVRDAKDKCSGMEAAAVCVENNKCEEDVAVMCYIARNMLGCKGGSWKDLKAVCAKSKSPIKEMSEADEELFGDHEFMTEGSGAPQSNFAVVGVVACAALLAVGLAAFLLRRRAAAAAQEAPEADSYQEL